ncbi:MAG: GNAT family N-acetyltransferase [Taibaiella sp.]|jgi:ribosomal protein S18 acetylase RimI-like enzyme
MNNPFPIEIVKVDLADIDQLIAISVDTFQETFGGSNSADNMDKYINESRSPEKVMWELRRSGAEFYFAKAEDGEIIGYLKINTGHAQTEPQPYNFMEIERIYVRNSYHGKKIGFQLMDFVFQKAEEKNKQTIWLGVWEHNLKAIQFYQKLGFVAFDKHSFMLGDDEQTDIMMKKEMKIRIV